MSVCCVVLVMTNANKKINKYPLKDNVELQAAYVLHARPYRDNSRLVELLTTDYGRVSAVARGLSTTTAVKSLRRALIQPFIPLLISWRGKSDLKTLTTYERRQSPKTLPVVNAALYSALYINELLMRLLPRYDMSHCDNSIALFTLYEKTLCCLQDSQRSDAKLMVESALRRFELRFLRLLGYGLELSIDCHTGIALQADRIYQFCPQHGCKILPLSTEQPLAIDHFWGKDLLAIADENFSSNTSNAAKRLCRLVLASHLGNKPLNSRMLFNGASKN